MLENKEKLAKKTEKGNNQQSRQRSKRLLRTFSNTIDKNKLKMD